MKPHLFLFLVFPSAPFSASGFLMSKKLFYWSITRRKTGSAERAESKPELLRRGWQAARAGGAKRCLGEHLAEGRLVPLHVEMAGTVLSQQLAAKASMAA